MPRRLLPLLVVVFMLGGVHAASAQTAPPALSSTAQALVRYLPTASELPEGYMPTSLPIEALNEEIVGAPGFADLAPVVTESRRMTEVGFTSRRGSATLPTIGTWVGAFVDADGAWTYARDYKFPYNYPPIQVTQPGPEVGQRSVLYTFTLGSGATATEVFHLTFQRDRLQIETILRAAPGTMTVDDVLPVARTIDAKIRANPPAAPTAADLALIEEPTPAVVVRGAARLFLDLFVDEIDAATLLADAWAGATKALERAGVTNVPPAPAYPDDDDAAIALHLRSFPMLESLADGRVTDAQMIEAAVGEMAQRRDDCHTSYLTPQLWQRRRAGFIGGAQTLIGFSSEKPSVDAPWRILSITPNSPAQRSGMRRGQVILSVNGRSVEGLTFAEVRALIDPREGVPNVFVIQNPSGGTITISVAPAQVRVPPMESEILPGNLGLLRFYGFESGPAGEEQLRLMREALTNFEARGVQGWIIDLRGNGGGSSATMNAMMSLFLEGGRTFGQFSRGAQPQFASASGNPLSFQRPIVFLTGRGSASAGEIMPGVLQARGRAVVVGDRTAGCIGSFLGGTGLLDGSVVEVTTSEVVIGPEGERRHRIGIQPNVQVAPPTVEDDEAGRDPQLAEATRVLFELTGGAPVQPAPKPPEKKAVAVWM